MSGFGLALTKKNFGRRTSTPSVPIELIIAASESNGSGTANLLTELPTGTYPTTASTKTLIFDAMNYNGAGAGWTGLIPGQMEQQPGSAYGAGAGNVVGTNTVGYWGRFDTIFRIKNPNTKLALIPCVEGGGRFSDSGSRARLANYDPQYSDGAYNTLKTMVQAAVSSLTSLGYSISKRTLFFDFGGNDAIAGNTTSAWATQVETFLSALVTDGIIASTDRIIFGTLSKNFTGTGGINNTSRVAQNTNIANLVAANTTYRSQYHSDGFYPMTSIGGSDAIHMTAASHFRKGELLAFEYMQEWHPLFENMNGGAAKVTREWDGGNYINIYPSVGTTTTGNVSGLAELQGSGVTVPSQATTAKQPSIGSFNHPTNGLPIRYLSGDGTQKILVSTAAASLAPNASWYMCGVVKGTNVANHVLMCEGGANSNNICYFLYTADTSGKDNFLEKDNSGALTGPLTSTDQLFNGNWNNVFKWKTGGQLLEEINGTAQPTQTCNPGAVTITRKSFFGANYNGGATEQLYSPDSFVRIYEWDNLPSSTVRAKWRTFAQTWLGSN